MTESSSTSTTAKKAAEKTAAVVADTLGTVVETTDVSLEIPAKVVVNKNLLVGAGVVVGISLGVAGVFGYNKLQEIRAKRKAEKIVVPDDARSLDEDANKK